MFNNIIDILPEQEYQILKNIFTYFKFDWHYLPSTVLPEVKEMVRSVNSHVLYDSEQFVHVLYDQQPVSEYWDIVKPIINNIEQKQKIKIVELGRVKANLLIKSRDTRRLINTPHIDKDVEGWHSMVFYVNQSDGDTVLFDKKSNQGFENLNIIDSHSPKANCAVMFESDRYHTSSNPVDNTTRIVLNFIFKIQNEQQL